MLLNILHWLNEHPERWVPIIGAMASLAADAVKQCWPAAERIIDALVHLIPNLPAAYRALRGEPSKPGRDERPKEEP